MTIAHHWTHVLPGTKKRLEAAMADPNGYIWDAAAVDARDALGRIPMGGEKYFAIVQYITDNTHTAKEKCAAFQSAVVIAQKAHDQGWLDKLTPEAVAHACGCLPEWIYQGEADDLLDDHQMYRDLRAGG